MKNIHQHWPAVNEFLIVVHNPSSYGMDSTVELYEGTLYTVFHRWKDIYHCDIEGLSLAAINTVRRKNYRTIQRRS
jgi:hypothetical protein